MGLPQLSIARMLQKIDVSLVHRLKFR